MIKSRTKSAVPRRPGLHSQRQRSASGLHGGAHGPAAVRLEQVRDVLGEVLQWSGPADGVLSRWLRARRELGARDRAEVAEAVYDVVRHLRRYRQFAESGHGNSTRRLAVLGLAHTLGLPSLKPALTHDEVAWVQRVMAIDAASLPPAIRYSVPDWLEQALADIDDADALFAALLQPAPLDIRVNPLKLDRATLLDELQINVEPAVDLKPSDKVEPSDRVEPSDKVEPFDNVDQSSQTQAIPQPQPEVQLQPQGNRERRHDTDLRSHATQPSERLHATEQQKHSLSTRSTELHLRAEATPWSPWGVRIHGRPALNRWPRYLDGSIEVQDEGSQLLALLMAPRRGEMIIDFCAGAGGKTLLLGALMRSTGRLYAFDVAAGRLNRLTPRLARSGLSNVEPVVIAHENDARVKRLHGKARRVLVDAPCSGTGTLRRNPDIKWRQHPQAIAELVALQERILASAARCVEPGGRLVYATCSLLPEENEAQIEIFLKNHPNFALVPVSEVLADRTALEMSGPYLKLRPDIHGTDGFFAAVFDRRVDAG